MTEAEERKKRASLSPKVQPKPGISLRGEAKVRHSANSCVLIQPCSDTGPKPDQGTVTGAMLNENSLLSRLSLLEGINIL